MQAAGKRYVWHGSKAHDYTFRIWNLSDLHWLARGCAEHEIRRDIDEIKNDPQSFWMGGGDYCDFIGYRDKRFDPDAIAEWVPLKKLGDLGRYGMEQIRDLFRPIAHKCLGLLIGNHELKYELHTEQEGLHHWLCQELRVPYLGYCCFFDLVFSYYSGQHTPVLRDAPSPKRGGDTRGSEGKTSYRIFAHHGAGYATTPGGKLNKLIGAMNAFDADLYFLGHVHDQMARREPVLTANADCTKITQRMRLGLISGSYLKTYNQGSISYGEQKAYRPTALGAAVAKITPATGKMEAAI